MVVVLPLASLKAKLGDWWLGVAGGISRFSSSLTYYFVTSPDLYWLMWTGKFISENDYPPFHLQSK